MNSLDEVKLDHVYQMVVDIPSVDRPGQFLVKKGDVVVTEEIDRENGLVLVRAECYTFAAKPEEIGPIGIEDFGDFGKEPPNLEG